MIVQCESCGTKYQLDETLLREEGSKVRCSRCKHVFVVRPPMPDQEVESVSPVTDAQAFQETITLDGPPPPPEPKEEPQEVSEQEAKPEVEEEPKEDQEEMDFDKVFEEVVEKEERAQAVSPEDLQDLEMEEERVEAEEPLARRARERAASQPGEDKHPPAKEKEKGPAAGKAGRSVFKTVLGILILLLVLMAGAGAALYFWAPELLPGKVTNLVPKKKHPIRDPGVSRLEFKDVKGAFVESRKAGQLLVIRGKVLNNYPGKRSYIRVRASILDENGRVLKQMAAYAGNNVTDKSLKNATLKEIHQFMDNRKGKGGSNVAVAPGAQIPFMIVFDRLPENMQEFEVEAVSSRPAQEK
ncbi:MAG: zinc-ribbon domain-containing protein [Deltaproteobacteria bacterium]|nr:zinc-ribbon domain-containing protein [Deltaproteobacteria bacterium]MBW2348920.1 zinc-ribbon domain-containing protein [Deltaproteobacteria bacterium]